MPREGKCPISFVYVFVYHPVFFAARSHWLTLLHTISDFPLDFSYYLINVVREWRHKFHRREQHDSVVLRKARALSEEDVGRDPD